MPPPFRSGLYVVSTRIARRTFAAAAAMWGSTPRSRSSAAAASDELADRHGGRGAWPAFEGLDVAAIAQGMGCSAVRVGDHDRLLAVLDDIVPGLRSRTAPVLVSIAVS
jgi:hypothetical protein